MPELGRSDAPAEAFRRAMEARDADAMRHLLEHHSELRAAVNEPLLPFDSPALVHCASTGNLAAIDVLLEFGADPNRRSSWWAGGFHPLHSASAEAAERLLAAGAVPDACAAAHLDRPELLARMLHEDPTRVRERGGDGQTPLHFARSRKVIDLLLDGGADIDARDVDHRASPAQWMLDRRRGEGRYDLARYLVDRGAATDIFLAAALGLTERARELLTHHPSLLDLRTTRGEYDQQPPSSFHIYMWTIGANRSPLQVAAQFEHDTTLEMMRRFASPVQRLLDACARGDATEAHALVEKHSRLVERLDAKELRALPDAAWEGDARAVELMLELGFDPLTPGHDGGTALHCAAWAGAAECVAVILRHPVARSGVEVRDTHYRGTPLGWCCHGSRHCGDPERDHPAVARMLLAAGATPPPTYHEASDGVRAVIGAFTRRSSR